MSEPDCAALMVGAGTMNSKSFPVPVVAEVPAAVVTVTSTVPTAWAGVVALMLVAPTTSKSAAASVPKSTSVAPVKLVPVMVTSVPPA